MDCEEFESTMIDELEGELDELASGATKRHVAGCARCAALYNGLRATRRVAVLPIVLPAADLEERILAAARAAQKVMPLRARVGRAISSAGGWAMRPQTAMAALFLLMIGSSVLLLRGRARAPGSSSITVSEQGAPTPTSALRDEQTRTAEAPHASGESAHGAPGDMQPLVTVEGLAPRERGDSKEDGHQKQRGPVVVDDGERNGLPNALPPPPPEQAPAPAVTALATTTVSAAASAATSAFGSALSLYHEKRYAEAYAAFRALGTVDADLYAARSQRDMPGGGCGAALPSFESLMARAWGSNAGYDAALDAARCYRRSGNEAQARERLTRLLGTPYASLAKAELTAGERSNPSANPTTTTTQAPATSASAHPPPSF